MIAIQDLKFRYNDDSFSMDITNLSIQEGEALAIHGPSGSGKSTFLSLVAGELYAESGEISYKGVSYKNLSKSTLKNQRLNKFGIVFQQPRLVEWMSVKDNILLPLKFYAGNTNTKEHLQVLSKELGITKLLNKKAGHLSLGEQMRVSILRALIKKPELILADEPTASLDAKLRENTIRLLIDEAKKINATLIIVSHEDFILNQMNRILSSDNWAFE